MDFSALSERDRQRMLAHIEQKQMKDTMLMYVKLTDRCFRDCITDFTSRAVVTKEETCVERCVEKFTKYSNRLALRFAEAQQEMQQQQQQQQQ